MTPYDTEPEYSLVERLAKTDHYQATGTPISRNYLEVEAELEQLSLALGLVIATLNEIRTKQVLLRASLSELE